ncbi:MAG: amidohydrolase, partial [Planctomycetota bacterium]
GPDDPAGGKIGRAPDGSPDGALYESAMGLLTKRIPASTIDEERAWMRRVLAEANGYGITQVGAIEPRHSIDRLLVPLDRAGELSLRVRATVRDAGPSLDAWLRALARIEDDLEPSPRVAVLGFKGFMDGSLGSRTAWMLEPFADDPQNRGFPLALASSGELQTLIGLAAERGLQPAVHAIGDRANRTLLDWYGALSPEQRGALRPRVEHAQHLDPEDVPRFAELGVVASMQPLHKADDGRYAQARLGPERCESSYAFRDLLDSGAVLAFGSDWPVVSCDPWRGIAAAVTGRTLDGARFTPEQSLTVEEALRAYTTGAAHALHSERFSGRLTPGYVADLVVLDDDVLAARTHAEIVGTRVRATLLDGDVVAGSLEGFGDGASDDRR